MLAFVAHADGSEPDCDGPQPGQWLAEYDVEYDDGRGFTRWTRDASQALIFADAAAAFSAWRSISQCHPVRATDGQPNRPLTAFTVVVHSPNPYTPDRNGASA